MPNDPFSALLKQKEELEQLTEKKIQLRLQEEETDFWMKAQERVKVVLCVCVCMRTYFLTTVNVII